MLKCSDLYKMMTSMVTFFYSKCIAPIVANAFDAKANHPAYCQDSYATTTLPTSFKWRIEIQIS